MTAGESILLLEEINRSLRREVQSQGQHKILGVTPSVVEVERDFEQRGWQIAGESRLLKVEASSQLAMRVVRRWLIKGRFDKMVSRADVRSKFSAWGLGAELPSEEEKKMGEAARSKRRSGFGISKKQWALLDETDAQEAFEKMQRHGGGRRAGAGSMIMSGKGKGKGKGNEGRDGEAKARAQFNLWFRNNASIARPPAALEARARRMKYEREIEAEDIKADRMRYEEMESKMRQLMFRSDSVRGKLLPGGWSDILHSASPERSDHISGHLGVARQEGDTTGAQSSRGVGTRAAREAQAGGDNVGVAKEATAQDGVDDVGSLLCSLRAQSGQLRVLERIEESSRGVGQGSGGPLEDVGALWSTFMAEPVGGG